MRVYLGLGSNLGDRRRNLAEALRRLGAGGVRTLRVSPVVESPALLPPAAPSEWNLPYLNLAVECEVSCTPNELAALGSSIERELGRKDAARWSPRPIDIDILLWGRERIDAGGLKIPHPQLHKRAFVLAPLIALEPRMSIPGLPGKTLLDWSTDLAHSIPLWMGIVNLTPDSFSDGGRHLSWPQVEPHLAAMMAAGVQIIDLGAESTRPGARALHPDEEWSRLEPVLVKVLERRASDPLPPWISVDTYHPEVARRSLDLGVEIINDVTGLTSPAMIELAGARGVDWIAMHHLTIPADSRVTLGPDSDPVEAVNIWLQERLEAWTAAGLDLSRIVFDPGIGFGKSALQSLALLRNAGQFRRHGLRLAIGHSRKSFMKTFAGSNERDKDLATVGVSLQLCRQGVEVLRVHDVPSHVAAYRGWSHMTA